MARPRPVMRECQLQISCDGNMIKEKSKICEACAKAIHRKEKMKMKTEGKVDHKSLAASDG